MDVELVPGGPEIAVRVCLEISPDIDVAKHRDMRHLEAHSMAKERISQTSGAFQTFIRGRARIDRPVSPSPGATGSAVGA